MKKIWEAPMAKIIPCELDKIQGDLRMMTEEELCRQLKRCGYPVEKETDKRSFFEAGYSCPINVYMNLRISS